MTEKSQHVTKYGYDAAGEEGVLSAGAVPCDSRSSQGQRLGGAPTASLPHTGSSPWRPRG